MLLDIQMRCDHKKRRIMLLECVKCVKIRGMNGIGCVIGFLWHIVDLWRARCALDIGFENGLLVRICKIVPPEHFGIYLHWVKAISNIRIIDYFGYFLEMWWTIRNAVSNNELCYCFANDSIWILNQLLWLFVFANHYFSADRLAVEGLPAKEDVTCGDCDEVYSMD